MACLEKTPSKFDECLDIKENASAPNQPEFEVLCSATVDALINKENTERKILALRHILEKDLKAADLKWSLFVAAVHTYRYDTCLRPFPPLYIKNETKDIESLVSLGEVKIAELFYVLIERATKFVTSCFQRKAVELVPPLPIIVQELKEPNIYKTKATTIELLFWVLIRLKDLHIKSISKDCVSY